MARNPFRNPRRRTASFATDYAATRREQAEINGNETRLEYTGEKHQVRGPGIGIEGIKKLINLSTKANKMSYEKPNTKITA